MNIQVFPVVLESNGNYAMVRFTARLIPVTFRLPPIHIFPRDLHRCNVEAWRHDLITALYVNERLRFPGACEYEDQDAKPPSSV